MISASGEEKAEERESNANDFCSLVLLLQMNVKDITKLLGVKVCGR